MRRRLTSALFMVLLFAVLCGCVSAASPLEEDWAEMDMFCYGQLSAQEQLAYTAIEYCLVNLIPSWNCGAMAQATIQKAYDCYLIDHPNVFWSDGYTYVTSIVNNRISGHRIEFTYTMTRAEIARANSDITEAMEEIVSNFSHWGPDYETVREIYDYFVANCTYDETNLDQSMYSVMVNKSGVCASFSKSFQWFMQLLDLPCTIVYGRLTQSDGMLSTTLGHAWNLVQIGGRWYHVDITSGVAVSAESGILDHRFLCATDSFMARTHVVENPVELPSCTDTSLEFFNHYGLLLDSYSRKGVSDVMLSAWSMGLDPSVRFSNYRAFSQAVEDLFTRQNIFSAISEATGLSLKSIDYHIDEERYIIRLDV